MNKMFKMITLMFCLISINNMIAQDTEEIWVATENYVGQTIYIDIQGLDGYTGDEFFVWAMQENDPPLEMEGVREDIYKTKTYYLISKSLKKYSIAEVIFYDEDDNVLASYSYKLNKEIPSFRYNYPIYQDTDQDAIFNKAMEYINASKN